MQSLKLLVILSLFVLGTLNGALVVTISCQPCTITCAQPSCFRVTATGYDKQVCGASTCSLNKNYTATLNSCVADMTGTVCSTGVCHFLEGSACALQYLGVSTCSSTPSWQALSCITCQSTPTCNKCLKLESPAGSMEACIGATCNGVQSVNVSVASCPSALDPQGNQCLCCYTANDTTLAGKLGVCTTANPLFTSSEFNIFAQKYISSSNSSSNNSTSTKFGANLLAGLTILCSILLAIL